MANRGNPDSHHGVLTRAATLLLATLAATSAPAQVTLFTPTASMGGVPLDEDSLRLWHKTRGYGQQNSHTAVGGRISWPALADGILFFDGQFKMANSNEFGVNVGGGARWFHEDLLTGSDRILGVSGWYDGEETPAENYFNQAAVSLESLGDRIDVRVNGNFPTDGVKGSDFFVSSSDFRFLGSQLVRDVSQTVENPLRVVDYEVAVRAFETQIWGYGGGYTLDGSGISTSGYKVGARGYVTRDLITELSVSDDNLFGTTTLFSIVWFPGRTTSAGVACLDGFEHRLQEPVFRNNYVAIHRVQQSGVEAVTNDAGQPFEFVHVDSNAPAPGDGSFESPLASLNDVAATSSSGNIILVHADSTFNGESVTLQDEQRLLGEGGNETNTVTNSQFGDLPLPETSPGALAGAIPVISNAPADAITVNQSGDPTLSRSVEISNLAVDGGARAIAAPGGAGALNMNRLNISNTTGNAIEVTPLVETLANGDQQVRFVPFVDRVTFDNIGGDDVNADAAHAVVSPIAVFEQVAVIDSTSTNGQGVGVNIANNSGTAFVFDYNYDGGATGSGAIRLTDAQANLSVQDNVITGGIGPGIEVIGGIGTHTLNNVQISDTGGAAILVDGGTATMNFTGRIEQGANAPAVRVSGGHTGALTFNEQDAGVGVIEATNGTGLQFDDADGNYVFSHQVVLNGGDAGIDMLNGADGTVTLTDAQITNPTGPAVNVEGGAGVLTFDGAISSNANVVAISVSDGHAGTLTFNELTGGTDPAVSVTNGDGLQFDNADGTYVFNGRVRLNGGNAGIDLLNGTDGVLTFTDAEITDPTGDAFNVEGGSASVTLTGSIEQANNASAVNVVGGHTGSLVFNEATTGSGVVNATGGDGLQFNDADGTYTFNHAVTLNGGDAGIDVANDSSGTLVFDSSSAITNPSGDALTVDGSDAVVTYSGSIDNNAGRSVAITNNTGGDVVLTGPITGTGQGVVVQNNTGGNFRFAGAVDLNTGANDAVTIDSHTGGGTRFDNLVVVTTAGAGFTASASDNVEVSGVGNTITTQTGVALNLNGVAVGPVGVTFASVSADGAANGIVLNNVSGGPVTVGAGGTNVGDGGAIVNTTGAGVSATNVERLSLNHLDVSLTAAEGIRVELNDGGATANFTLNNSSVANSSGNEALVLTGSGAISKQMNVLIQDSQFVNNDAVADAVDLEASGAVDLNLTVLNNNFTNSNVVTGRPFEATANNAAANVRLNLNGNTGVAGNGGDGFFLEQIAGSFSVEDLANVDLNNTGGVNQSGTINNDPGSIPTP